MLKIISKTFKVQIVNWSSQPVVLQAKRKLRFCKLVHFKGLGVYQVALVPGQQRGFWPTTNDGKTLVSGGESWMTSQEHDPAIMEAKVPECGKGSAQAVLWIFHLTKAKDPPGR